MSLAFPTTPQEAGVWTLTLCVVYLVVACLVAWRSGNLDKEFTARVTYDAITFSLAGMLLVGVLEPKVFVLIGGITTPAIIAGLSGVVYSIRAIFLAAEKGGDK